MKLLYCEGNISMLPSQYDREGNIRYRTWKNFGREKIGKFSESLTIHQIFTHQCLQIYGEILSYQNGRTTKVF